MKMTRFTCCLCRNRGCGCALDLGEDTDEIWCEDAGEVAGGGDGLAGC